MYKVLGAVFGVGGIGHVWSDDKILGLLIAIFVLVWIAAPPGRPSRTGQR